MMMVIFRMHGMHTLCHVMKCIMFYLGYTYITRYLISLYFCLHGIACTFRKRKNKHVKGGGNPQISSPLSEGSHTQNNTIALLLAGCFLVMNKSVSDGQAMCTHAQHHIDDEATNIFIIHMHLIIRMTCSTMPSRVLIWWIFMDQDTNLKIFKYHNL